MPVTRTGCKGLVGILGLAGILLMITGCGGKQGVTRYDLSGQVKYDGEIVPSGYIRFIPNKKQGNRGPGVSVSIVDGHYQTARDLGTVGGPHVAKVVGTDGVPYKQEGVMIPMGRRIFPPFDEIIDLPKESGATHDFDLVPAPRKKNRSR